MDTTDTEISNTNCPNLISRITHNKYSALITALLGGILALIQLYTYSRTQVSVLDEGAYLYKGFLFLRGDYSLYQDFGPWSNHMPLSFLVPGFVQYTLGPGIAVGRNFSILLTMLMLLGVWVIARRFSGYWWAALAVWIFALNPAVLKIYSIAVPQSQVVFMLVWTLVLVLGKERPYWQLILGAVLSGLMVMTRLNMLPVVPLLVLYILWQNGLAAGLISGLVSMFTILLGHALFWPEILKMWALQLPRSILPVLDPYRSPADKTPIWNPQVSIRSRLLSFLHALRIHFAVIVGVIAALLLWPKKSKWPDSSTFKAVVFLLSLFIVLLGIHFWAALFQNYCVFCLSGYLAYFGVVGLLILIITIPYWTKDQPLWKQIIIAAIILIITSAVGFSSFEDTAELLLNTPIPRLILDFPNINPGYVTIDKILINKFDLEYKLLRRIVPAMAGLAMGILVLLLGSAVNWYYKRWRQRSSASGKPETSAAYWSMVVLLATGLLLSPTIFLGGARSSSECSQDVVLSYQAVGQYLNETIPAGSRTFWHGGLSVAPLLYASDVTIYPPQINDGYSYFLEGNPQGLYQFGYWSKDLAKSWLREADYVLIEERSYKGWWKDDIQAGDLVELEPTPLQVECRGNSWIHIFMKEQ